MKFSSIYWIAACLFFLANGFVLFGESVIKPCKTGRVPKNIPCPTQEPCDCDKEEKKYIIEYEPVENYGADAGHPHKDEEPMIYESGFRCGGFDKTVAVGPFGSDRVNDGDFMVKEGADGECYREYNCTWYPDKKIEGYVYKEVRQPDGSIYREANWATRQQSTCFVDGEVTTVPFNGITLVKASWYDCFGDDADWGGE